ncbi:MAG: hypothetical protein ISR78_04980 [Spirochaetia bacterium]|nr:hypothetical protein [Spirochaetia bacterium]
MKKIDKILAAIIISLVFLFSSYQLFIWCGRLFGLHVNAMALTGLTVGVLFCLIWLQEVLRNLYTLNWWYLIIFYLISSLVLFIHMKTLMIYLLIYALFAGLYTGRRVGYKKGTEFELKKELKKAALFSEIVLVIYYVISIIVLFTTVGTLTRINFIHFLSLEIPQKTLWLVVFFMGILLLPLNYFLVIWIGRSVYSVESAQNKNS